MTTYSITLPNGEHIDGLTRRQARQCLPWMPPGSSIAPPPPPASGPGLDLLDALCRDSQDTRARLMDSAPAPA